MDAHQKSSQSPRTCRTYLKGHLRAKMMRKRKLPYPEWMLAEIIDPTIKSNLSKIPTTTKIKFKCTICGHEYYQTIHNHIHSDNTPKQGCPKCGKNKQAKTYSNLCKEKRQQYPQWFVDDLFLESDKKKAINKTLVTSDIVQFKCKECGNIYNQRVASHIKLSTGESKKGCPLCGIKKQINSSRKIRGIIKPYPQWFIDDLYLDSDKESAKKINFYAEDEKQFYCAKHNLIYKQKVRFHIDTKTHDKLAGCPKCKVEKLAITRSNNRTFPQWFIDELAHNEDKEKARNGTLQTSDVVDFYCEKHDLIYSKSVAEQIKLSTGEKRRGCPQCGYDKYFKTLSQRRKYPQWFIDDLVLDEDKNRAKNGTLSTSEKVLFKCENGHIFEQLVKNHINLSSQERFKGCPKCPHNRSSIEIEIDDFINSLGFTTEHKLFTSSILQSFEADIFIPEKNIAIEYNGSFWHKTIPYDVCSKNKYYHNKKFYSFKELGIQLISIFDVDWYSNKDKIKNYLKDILLPIEHKIYARKTIIKNIDGKIANEMYSKYHLLGSTTIQSISYGLFYNDELISCMSFQKGRYKNENKKVWCLSRFVTKSGYAVVGSANKLLKKFIKENNPDIIISYSDNDYFSGNIYKIMGFECKGDTHSPRYYWFYQDKELKREQCQLRHLSKQYPELYTESLNQKENKEDYIMVKLGAFKVYRSGHTKWIWNA